MRRIAAFPLVARVLVLAVIVLLGVTLAATATAARVIGTGSASGDHAIALAGGQAKRPSALFIRVLTKPRQRVNVTWLVVCTRKGSGASSENGRFAARAPVRRRLRLPMADADECTVNGSGRLSRSGRITVLLLARSRKAGSRSGPPEG